MDRQFNGYHVTYVSMIALGQMIAAAGFSIASDETDVELPADALLISVRDAASNKLIPEFRVLAGVKSSVSDAFEKRMKLEIVCWQPHTIREGRDGMQVWPLKQAYDVMALRIEADGFMPVTSEWINKKDGPQRVEILMRQDPRVSGRILQPDGKPAAKAVLAIALPQKDAVLEEGRLRGRDIPAPKKVDDRWRLPSMFESDDTGEYRVPMETDAGAAILIMHESGVAEMPYAKFAALRKITMLPWGRIEGRVLWKDKPGADEQVSLSIHRDDYGYPGTIAQYGNVKTDADGNFVFDRVLPGHAQVSRGITVTDDGAANPSMWIFPGLFAHVTVRSGDPTRMFIGGRGRNVTGRLTGRAAWNDVTFHFHPTAPSVVGFGGDNGWQAFGRFRSSPIGPLFFRDKLQPSTNGTFEIPNVLPGRYQFFVSEVGAAGFIVAHSFAVDQETPGEERSPLDLGEIKLKPQ